MNNNYRIIRGDVMRFLYHNAAQPNPVLAHAALFDPPYNLTSIVKRFGKSNAAETSSVFKRSSKGFMGMAWDSAITHSPPFWEALGANLLDGAFVIAFNGASQFWKQAAAADSAGFIIHPFIFGWVYGSGLAKPSKVDQRIDQRNGHKRPPTGCTKSANDFRGNGFNKANDTDNPADYSGYQYEYTAPASAASQRWEGWGYGSQVLKPALEPICVFQKPHAYKTQLDGILENGTGSLNIGETRVNNRVPSNYITTHHPDCKPHCCNADCGVWQTNQEGYFLETESRIYNAAPAYYCAKPQPDERHAGLDGRNTHPTVKPLDLTTYLAKLLLPPVHIAENAHLLIPFAGSGSEIAGAINAGWQNIIGIELDRKTDGTRAGYIDIAHQRIEALTTPAASVDNRQLRMFE